MMIRFAQSRPKRAMGEMTTPAAAGFAIAATCFVLPAGGQTSEPLVPSVPQLLDICNSATVAEASRKGDALGWARSSDQQFEGWRKSFLAYNGGTVEVVGWQRGDKPGEGNLSFWVATGPNGHRACNYSPADPTGFLAALTNQLGKADGLDKYDFGTTAFWERGAAEIYFSQVGSSASVSIGYPK